VQVKVLLAGTAMMVVRLPGEENGPEAERQARTEANGIRARRRAKVVGAGIRVRVRVRVRVRD
jgi:hypothetical protein